MAQRSRLAVLPGMQNALMRAVCLPSKGEMRIDFTMAEKITFTENIYTYQIDFNRHVSNIVYIQWMEMGRLKVLEAVGLPIHKIDAEGFAPILIETQIRYKRPLFMGETVVIQVWLSELTRLYAWMEFSFHNSKGELTATGRQRGLFINTETGRPIRLDHKQQTLFHPYLIPNPEQSDQ